MMPSDSDARKLIDKWYMTTTMYLSSDVTDVIGISSSEWLRLEEEVQKIFSDRDRLAEQIKVWKKLAEGNAESDARHCEELRLAQQKMHELMPELQVYREGGVTEEILRRNDGYIKVGRGCVIVREDEWNAMAERVKEL